MPYGKKTPGSRRALREAKKRNRNNSFNSKEIRRRYLIACEGTETEPNYFNELKSKLPKEIVVMAKGDGRNTLGLIKWAEKEKRSFEESIGEQIDEVWIVMDRDSFKAHHFDNAIRSAEAKGFKLAWSNECIELCVLLHFKGINHAMSRKEIYKELSDIFGSNYEKDGKSEKLYSLIRKYDGCENDAIDRAKKLWNNKNYIPSEANPATGVFDLVETLNKYIK